MEDNDKQAVINFIERSSKTGSEALSKEYEGKESERLTVLLTEAIDRAARASARIVELEAALEAAQKETNRLRAWAEKEESIGAELYDERETLRAELKKERHALSVSTGGAKRYADEFVKETLRADKAEAELARLREKVGSLEQLRDHNKEEIEAGRAWVKRAETEQRLRAALGNRVRAALVAAEKRNDEQQRVIGYYIEELPRERKRAAGGIAGAYKLKRRRDEHRAIAEKAEQERDEVRALLRRILELTKPYRAQPGSYASSLCDDIEAEFITPGADAK